MIMNTALLPLLLLAGSKTWEMPEFPSFNKLPAHATLLPYASSDEALTFERTRSAWFLNLNGQWGFKLLPKPEAATTAEVHADDWAAIQVPGNWTMQGFGHPHYTNVQMPFPGMPPHVPEANPTGMYRRTFTVPETWRDRRVILHFAGC